ncbi:MAG: UbiA family prenyltransferase [Geobacter sp.]|nr:UbiA family prenyltransferase [Geobacter sp.]
MTVAFRITIKGYLDLCRVTNLPSVWTNVLCALLLATGRFSWQGYLFPAFALSCYYLAGICLNDLCDAAYDRVNRPSRPIPSGTVTPRGALLLTLALFTAGTLPFLAAPHVEGLLAAILLMAVIVWYDFRHKRNPLSVLLMALCRLLVFAVTALAATGRLSALPALAGALQFAYVVCISLVARHENARAASFPFPVIPLMLAGIPLLDGVLLALLVSPAWLLAGLCGSILMLIGQRFVRGD